MTQSPRALRRAAEHAARKAAYQQAKLAAASPNPELAAEPTTPAEQKTKVLTGLEAYRRVSSNPELLEMERSISEYREYLRAQRHAREAEPPTEPTTAADETVTAAAETTEHSTQSASASPAQFTANKANAQLSTGPITSEGKAISARNHTTHGLTTDISLVYFRVLPNESQAEYDRSLAAYQAEWKPATETEQDLVKRLATHAWLRDRALRFQDSRLSLGLNDSQANKQFEMYGRYYNLHLRAYNKALADLMRLRSFQMRQKNSEAMLERRAQDAQIRFESQKRKAEEHAAKMETLRLKQEAQKQRNNSPKPAEITAPLAEAAVMPLASRAA